MYYLFRRWGTLPGDYYNRPMGERLLIQAFASKQVEEAKHAGR